MIRKAFVMEVYPGKEKEYKERHNPIWPELEEILKKQGVHNYSIFLHAETNQLFGYAEIEDEARWQSIANADITKKWWKYMKEIMPANDDNSPVSMDLNEVFHID